MSMEPTPRIVRVWSRVHGSDRSGYSIIELMRTRPDDPRRGVLITVRRKGERGLTIKLSEEEARRLAVSIDQQVRSGRRPRDEAVDVYSTSPHARTEDGQQVYVKLTVRQTPQGSFAVRISKGDDYRSIGLTPDEALVLAKYVEEIISYYFQHDVREGRRPRRSQPAQ